MTLISARAMTYMDEIPDLTTYASDHFRINDLMLGDSGIFGALWHHLKPLAYPLPIQLCLYFYLFKGSNVLDYLFNLMLWVKIFLNQVY